jgi:flagellar biosynthesis component FlhA
MRVRSRNKVITKTAEEKTAEEVIDQAIRENRFGERLLYGFAVLFVLTGLVLMTFAVVNGSPFSAVLSLISSALFLPAMQSARRTRQESMAIRLLQAPLRQSDNSKEAAEAIRTVFVEIFGTKNNDRNKKTPEP